MKKYYIFIGSLILLLAAYQIGTGLWLTTTHVPGVGTQAFADNMPLINSLVVLGSASLAFLLAQKIRRKTV